MLNLNSIMLLNENCTKHYHHQTSENIKQICEDEYRETNERF